MEYKKLLLNVISIQVNSPFLNLFLEHVVANELGQLQMKKGT